jgi:transcriptional regulator GlxA family with amidase domain
MHRQRVTIHYRMFLAGGPPGALVVLVLLAAACGQAGTDVPSREAPPAARISDTPPTGVLTAGFVVLDQVYNSELMAPYDVLHHTVFRDTAHYVQPFAVSPTGAPVTTFEGLTVTPHHSFATAPPIDILVIPSTAGSMTTDLEDPVFMDWLAGAVARARYVITVCDGAFPLAATGALDGRMATTFPADRALLAARFPAVDVRSDARFVVDGKFITSVGGARSYEPALYLVEHLYARTHAEQIAEGLVLDWRLEAVPHLLAEHAR